MPKSDKPKRGLQRKTPLRSTTGLKQGAPLKRGKGLKQGSGLQRSAPLKQGKPLERSKPATDNGRTSGARAPLPRSGLGQTRKPISRKPMKTKPPAMSPEEKQCRAIVAERSEGLCECCGRAGALEKAHRVSRSQGGKWDPANILDLCHKCHQQDHHANPAEAYEGGWHLRSMSDPLTSPVLLWKGGRYDWALLDNEGGWSWCDTPTDA